MEKKNRLLEDFVAEAARRNMTYGQLQVEETLQMLQKEREKWRGLRVIMIKGDYSELLPDVPYKVERVYKNGKFRIKNKPARYDSSNFTFLLNGNILSFSEAYRGELLWRIKT